MYDLTITYRLKAESLAKALEELKPYTEDAEVLAMSLESVE
jgi:hypothetical protein